jgi:hypothetical protein
MTFHDRKLSGSNDVRRDSAVAYLARLQLHIADTHYGTSRTHITAHYGTLRTQCTLISHTRANDNKLLPEGDVTSGILLNSRLSSFMTVFGGFTVSPMMQEIILIAPCV